MSTTPVYSTLLAAADLHRHLGRPGWTVVDCRFDLARPESGREAYTNGHIPGAAYAHLDEHLSSPIGPGTGRHPLPDPGQLAATLGSWGIANDSQVVVYDSGNGAHAARLWWLLRWLGHDRVALLDGGFKAWAEAGLPVSTEIPAPVPARFVMKLRPELVMTTAELSERLAAGPAEDWRLLDARAAERYAGIVEPLDPVAGHVPGAHNHPFTSNLGTDGRFLPTAELKENLARSLGTVPPEQSVMMCGSGVTACHNLVALAAAGFAGGRLYAGSWSEWIRDPARPIATGTKP